MTYSKHAQRCFAFCLQVPLNILAVFLVMTWMHLVILFVIPQPVSHLILFMLCMCVWGDDSPVTEVLWSVIRSASPWTRQWFSPPLLVKTTNSRVAYKHFPVPPITELRFLLISCVYILNKDENNVLSNMFKCHRSLLLAAVIVI